MPALMKGLVSIHIPKTAGRSFYSILNQVYPAGTLAHFDQKNYQGMSRHAATFAFLQDLNENVNVIHGHFMFNDVKEHIRENNLDFVTWLREPVDRVLSNYRFFIQRTRRSDADEKMLSRRNESLLEYARLEESRNRMSKFLDGAKLENAKFIGIMEYFEEDIKKLGLMLDWNEFKISHENMNMEFRESDLKSVSQETIQEIRDLNTLDLRLYETALEYRLKRIV